VRTPRSLASSLLPEHLEAEDLVVLAAVLLLPWAFGGVEVWAYRTAALLLTTGAAICLVKHGWAGLGLGSTSRWLLPALLLAVWAVVQIVPMPPGVIRTLSPQADAIYRDTFPGYGQRLDGDLLAALQDRALAEIPEFDGFEEPERGVPSFLPEVEGRWSGWRTLSLLPSAGVERVLWYLALLLGFLVVRQRCASPDVARLYRGALFGLFLGLAVFGLLYAATSNEKLYWVRYTVERARPFGPYVNPTNFAGVMELAVPWLLGYVLLNFRVTRGQPLAGLRLPLILAATVLCSLAAVATATKSSVILILVSVLVVSMVSMRRIRGRLLILAAAAGGLAVALPLLLRTGLGARFQQFVDISGGGVTEVGRFVGWRAATGMLADYPLVGTGFGAFRDVFPRYMPAGEYARWAQLHNDYFELLIEGGLVAAVLLVWLMWGFWRRSLRRSALWNEGRVNPEAVGLLLGLASLSVHAAFDFNHQIPANALLFVTLAAIAVVRGETPASGDEGGG
jgi:O-antigen ligase